MRTTKPQAHPTKWMLVMIGLPRGKPAERIRRLRIQAVVEFDTQAEAEAELAKATDGGERGYVLPPLRIGAARAVRNERSLARREPFRIDP